MYCAPVLSACFMKCSLPYQPVVQSGDAKRWSDEEVKTIKKNDEKNDKSCQDRGAGQQQNNPSPPLEGLNFVLDAGVKLEKAEGMEMQDSSPVHRDSNLESTQPHEMTSEVGEEGRKGEVDLGGSLSTHEYHENLHKRLSQSVSADNESRSSEPLDIPSSSDSMKGRKDNSTSSNNGHIPGHVEMHHKFSGEHLTVKAQTRLPFTSIEMKPINRRLDEQNWKSRDVQGQSPSSSRQ